MPKPFYADYVNHMVRAYAALLRDGKTGDFKSDVDADNYTAVDRVLHELPEEDQHVVLEVLTQRDPLRESIARAAHSRNLRTDAVWTLVSRVSGRIAKDRRLI